MADTDRISALPDELLCHILSFLQTTEAVATSVFSKRWRHLWRSVPALNLYTDTEDTTEADDFFFNDFVYSVLLFRNAATPIKKFRLEVHNAPRLDFVSISKWVNFVTQCRVEHLHLIVTTYWDTPQLPISILRCTTLVVLELHGFQVTHVSSTGFPSLKMLHLEDFVFTSVQLFKEFLAGCPNLEDLCAHDIKFVTHMPSRYCEELKSLSLPKLNRANIVGHQWLLYYPLKPFYNVKFLNVEIQQVHHDFPSFPNLTHLELIIEPDHSRLLAEMLNHCPKLQSLSLKRLHWNRNPENWTEPEVVPEGLLNLKTCSFRHFKGLEVELQLARYILKNARVLQTMTILTLYTISQTQMNMIRENLSSHQRSSSRCQIIVRQLSMLDCMHPLY